MIPTIRRSSIRSFGAAAAVSVLALVAPPVSAQPVTGSGQAGRVPKFVGPTQIANSNIFETPTGRVGIGTPNPGPLRLRVEGSIGAATNSPTATLIAVQSGPGHIAEFWRGGSPKSFVNRDGWVGVGLPPQSPLHVLSTDPAFATLESSSPGEHSLRLLTPVGNPSWLRFYVPGENGALAGVGRANGRDLVFQTGGGPGSDGFYRMVVTAAGNVGVGTTMPTATFEVAAGASTLADAWSTRSSARLKSDVKPIEDALGKVRRLEGVSFTWNESRRKSLGFVAEDVGKVLPELVTYEENGHDARSLDYAKLTAVLVEAVKAQQAEIDALKREVEALKAR